MHHNIDLSYGFDLVPIEMDSHSRLDFIFIACSIFIIT